MEIVLFDNNINLLDTVDERLKIHFKSIGFVFTLQIEKVKVNMPFNVYGIRIIVNDAFTHSLDFSEMFLVDWPEKVELVLLKEIFSNRVSKDLIKSIEHVKPTEL